MAIFNSKHSIIVGTQAKCGSTSLEKMLLKQPGWEYVLPKHLPPTLSTTGGVIANHRLMQVRNPYERFWSIYRWNVKRAPHEALSHLTNNLDDFVHELHKRYGEGRWRTYAMTQYQYALEFRATDSAKLEDGGLVPLLRKLTGEDLPDLPELNVNRTHLERPELSSFAQELLDLWCEQDMEVFGYA